MKLNKRLSKGLLFVFLLEAIGAEAQRKISLSEAQNLAVENAKILKIDAARKAQTIAKIDQLTASTKYPTVNASLSYNRLSNNIDPFKIVIPGGPAEGITVQPIILNQFQNRLNISQLVYAGERTKNALKALQLQLETGRLETEKDIEDIKYNVTQTYFSLYKLKVTKQLISENLKLIDENIKDLENALKQGVALENDVLRLKLQRSNVELSGIDADNAIESANFNFNILTGLPLETVVEPDSASIFQSKVLLSLTDYLNDSQKNRHDLKAIAMRKEAAITQNEVTKAALKPTVTVGGSYMLDNPNQRVFPQKESFIGTWALGATVTYSISNLWNVKHQVAENQAVVNQIQGSYEQLSDAIKMEINQSYSALKQAKEKVKVSEIAVSQANENYRVTNNRYKEGIITLTDLLNANFQVLQTKINLLNAQTDVESAYQRLMKAVNN